MKKLTAKQQAFCEHYVANGFNATQAAIGAGYSEQTARFIGCENLTKPNIAEYIARFKAKATSNAIMTRVEALETLSTNVTNAEEYRDQHQAIKQLSAMQGWNAPKKAELSGADGGAMAITVIERKII